MALGKIGCQQKKEVAKASICEKLAAARCVHVCTLTLVLLFPFIYLVRRLSMLVLSRKQNERILIGDSVVVTVVRVSGDKVRIGIEAPANVRVLRDELEDESLGDVTLDPTDGLPAKLLRYVG